MYNLTALQGVHANETSIVCILYSRSALSVLINKLLSTNRRIIRSPNYIGSVSQVIQMTNEKLAMRKGIQFSIDHSPLTIDH
jgi:hypothetical protein